jgi:hypothetical protein
MPFDRNKPNIVITVNGGAGKNIIFTTTAKNVKIQYPDHNLVVISAYPELFLNIPFIDRVYRMGSTPYLHEDLIASNTESLSYAVEPYQHDGYLNEKEHLAVTWAKVLGVEDKNIKHSEPFIKLTSREMELFRNMNGGLLSMGKPILLIQPYGGANNNVPYNWCRDLPPRQAQELVNRLSTDFTVVCVTRQEQPKLEGCVQYTAGSVRDLALMLTLSTKRLFIDSFCQHAAAALGLASTVCWITNKPKVFGYPIHNNIVAPKGVNSDNIHRIDSLYQAENWEGTFNNYYPYENDQIFNLNQIIESVYKQP